VRTRYIISGTFGPFEDFLEYLKDLFQFLHTCSTKADQFYQYYHLKQVSSRKVDVFFVYSNSVTQDISCIYIVWFVVGICG
jgi:hypothetical protein